MSEQTKRWWQAAGIRALKTMAQTAVATIGAAAVLSQVCWPVVASVYSFTFFPVRRKWK